MWPCFETDHPKRVATIATIKLTDGLKRNQVLTSVSVCVYMIVAFTWEFNFLDGQACGSSHLYAKSGDWDGLGCYSVCRACLVVGCLTRAVNLSLQLRAKFQRMDCQYVAKLTDYSSVMLLLTLLILAQPIVDYEMRFYTFLTEDEHIFTYKCKSSIDLSMFYNAEKGWDSCSGFNLSVSNRFYFLFPLGQEKTAKNRADKNSGLLLRSKLFIMLFHDQHSLIECQLLKPVIICSPHATFSLRLWIGVISAMPTQLCWYLLRVRVVLGQCPLTLQKSLIWARLEPRQVSLNF